MFIPKIYHAVLQNVLTCIMSLMTSNIIMIIITHQVCDLFVTKISLKLLYIINQK